MPGMTRSWSISALTGADARAGQRWSSTDWIVITFRDGKIVRDVWFDDRATALEAAGLRE